jgi:hypothetical protein
MKHLILVIILFFVGVLPVFSWEIIFNPVQIIDGTFLKFERSEISSTLTVYFFYQKLSSSNITYNFQVFNKNKSTGVITLTPVCYSNGDRVFETLTVDDVVYYYFPSDGSGDSGGSSDNTNDSEDDVTESSESVVCLGRIELYLLWLLCVQCISCGILLLVMCQRKRRACVSIFCQRVCCFGCHL